MSVSASASMRENRVAESIRTKLAGVLQHKLRDPRLDGLTLTISEVRVARGLGQADVYITISPSVSDEKRDECMSVLNSAAGFMRSEVARGSGMRYTPALRVIYDDLPDRSAAVDSLIHRAIQIETETARSNDS